jgi:hypothetical protein
LGFELSSGTAFNCTWNRNSPDFSIQAGIDISDLLEKLFRVRYARGTAFNCTWNRNSPDFSIQAGIDVKIDDAKFVHLGSSRKIIQSAV